MSRLTNSLLAVALVAAVGATAAPAYAGADKRPDRETEKTDKRPAAKAEPACTADEIEAQLAAGKTKEKAHAPTSTARDCAHAKAVRAEHAKKKRAEQAARAREFQAIGVVATHDAAAGTVIVFVKAGSRDLHKRRVAVRVTAKTVIKLDGSRVPLTGLVSGTFVSVHGVRRDGGALVAVKIIATSPGVEEEPAPSSAPSSSAPSPAAPSPAAPSPAAPSPSTAESE